MLACYDMGGVPTDEESLVTYLSDLARRTQVLNPNLPLPMPGGISPEGSEREEMIPPEEQSTLWPAQIVSEEGDETRHTGLETGQQQEENGAEGSVLSLESEEDGIVNMSD